MKKIVEKAKKVKKSMSTGIKKSKYYFDTISRYHQSFGFSKHRGCL